MAKIVVKNIKNSPTDILINNPINVTPISNFNIRKKQKVEINNFNVSNIKFDLAKLRTDHMTDEEERQITKLVKNYSDIFHVENEPLTFTNKIKHTIRTTDEIPIHTKAYRYPQIHKKEVERQIDELFAQDIITHSTSLTIPHSG